MRGLYSSFSSLGDQGPLISGTQQSRQSFLRDCAPQCHWASPCCQAFQSETSPLPAQLCESSLPLLSPLSLPLSLLSFPCPCSWFSLSSATTCKQLLAPWCLPGRTSLEEWCEVGMVCICYFYSLFRGSICRDLGPLPDVRTALGDPGRSQGPVPRPQHLPPPSPRNFCPSPFPMWKPAKINAHILTAALWAGSDPSSPTESTSSVPSSSLGHFAAAGSRHLHHPHPWGHLEP